MLGRCGHLSVSRIAAVLAMTGTLPLVMSASSSPGQAVVPDVIGLSASRAYDAVHEAGFAVQIDGFVWGHVTQQSRPAGTAGRAGTAVALSIAQGPQGMLPPGGHGRVPRVFGKPLANAIYTLQTHGLLWSAWLPPLPATMRPSLFDNYRIARQKPKPGTQFTQTVTRELANGDVLTETSTVGLVAELRPS
jgi:beta-lactam-binding protein with PASTA domain